MHTDLEKAILSVVAYFDFLGYPLTFLELIKWLGIETEAFEIKKSLSSDNLKVKIDHKSGFYFLTGRDFLVEKRLAAYSLADQKFKRAMKIIKIMSWFPWIRAIAVYGSMSLNNPRPESDIDLFIVTEAGRIWSSRFFINVFLKVFNLRPNEKKSRDKICASYLVSRDQLNLRSAMDADNEMFYSFSVSQFVFIYGEDEIEKKFFEVNGWLKENFPAWWAYQIGGRRKVKSSRSLIKEFLEKIASVIPEKYFEKFQMFILPAGLREMKDKNESTDVIINRQMLKLHSSNRSRGFERDYKLKINHLINGQD